MIGAIAGDIVGREWEMTSGAPPNFTLFRDEGRFSDDTVCTMAVAKALLTDYDFEKHLRDFAARYPGRGFGGSFLNWLDMPVGTKNDSWGNGAVMRVSPCGWYAKSIGEAIGLATAQATPSHNHPDAIKGAQACAATIYMARTGVSKADIRTYLNNTYLFHIVDTTQLSVNAWRTAQLCIDVALKASSWEEGVRFLVQRGGDTDTFACIAGSVLEAFHGVPDDIQQKAMSYLSDEFKEILAEFAKLTK